jgi:hypothetical protein
MSRSISACTSSWTGYCKSGLEAWPRKLEGRIRNSGSMGGLKKMLFPEITMADVVVGTGLIFCFVDHRRNGLPERSVSSQRALR